MKECKLITETNVNLLLKYLEKNKINCSVSAGFNGIIVSFQDMENKKYIHHFIYANKSHYAREYTVYDALAYISTDAMRWYRVICKLDEYIINKELETLSEKDKECIVARFKGIMDRHVLGEKTSIRNPNIDYIEFILTKLTRRDILEQLAEEASEVADVGNSISHFGNVVAKDSNKLIRSSEDTNNLTPEEPKKINNYINHCVNEIYKYRTINLEEECGDLNMCLDLLHHIDDGEPIEKFHTLDNPKWKRWAERLGFISF